MLSQKVRLEVLDVLSIDEDKEMIDCVYTTPSWMEEIITYLKEGNVPVEKVRAHRVRRKSPWYVLNEDKLLRRSFTLPYLKCLRESEMSMPSEKCTNGYVEITSEEGVWLERF